MEKQTNLPVKPMLLLALLQGLGLMILHQSIDFHFWPYQHPQWLMLLYSLLLIWPTTVLLSISRDNFFPLVKYSLGFALIICPLAYYIGYQALPVEHIELKSLLFTYSLTMGIASFKALMYWQHFSSGNPFTYSALFRWSWRNFLTLGFALLFSGSFWLILFLWGALFKVIDIHFFEDLFENPWFYYPALSLAMGFGVIIFRNLSHVIDTITRLQQALMKYLLVVIVLVSVLFLAALPLTGLESLWERGGSILILWLQAIMLFFVNAVYQDDPQIRPYSPWVHRFVYLGVALLPLYSAISLYGLSLRIDQYGWSMSRYWAVLVWFFMAVFATGYLWGIIKLKDNWVEQLSRVNVVVGLMVLGAMLLLNSPLLDFRKMVVHDQLARVESQTTPLEDLDIYYLKRHLARPGHLALGDLKKRYGVEHPKFGLRVSKLLEARDAETSHITEQDFTAALAFIGTPPPKALVAAMFERESKETWKSLKTKTYYIVEVELSRDEVAEYLLVREMVNGVSLSLFHLDGNDWRLQDIIGSAYGLGKLETESFIQALEEGHFSVETSKWDDFEINGRVYRVSQDEP